ncbi:MAG: hypothetical protein R3E68_06085 [Burkholderiaceae bacterium]
MNNHSRAGRAELTAPLNLQRKAAILRGGAFDHAGRVQVRPMAEFDMDRTIFGGLEGIARKIMAEKLARDSVWSPLPRLTSKPPTHKANRLSLFPQSISG